MVEVCSNQLVDHMLAEVEQGNPTIDFRDFVEPFLVVAVVVRMEIQHVLPYEDEPFDALVLEGLNDIALERHHIVEQGVVPFADELEDGKPLLIIRKEDLGKEGGAPDVVPLGVDEVIVDAFGEMRFAVDPFMEG